MSKTEKAPKKESSRVDRGGSWSSTPQYARLGWRGNVVPGARGDYIGFRLVEVLDEQD
jgi:hypothetical protein